VPTQPQSAIKTLTSVAAALMLIVILLITVTLTTTSVWLHVLLIMNVMVGMLFVMRLMTTASIVEIVRVQDVAQVVAVTTTVPIQHQFAKMTITVAATLTLTANLMTTVTLTPTSVRLNVSRIMSVMALMLFVMMLMTTASIVETVMALGAVLDVALITIVCIHLQCVKTITNVAATQMLIVRLEINVLIPTFVNPFLMNVRQMLTATETEFQEHVKQELQSTLSASIVILMVYTMCANQVVNLTTMLMEMCPSVLLQNQSVMQRPTSVKLNLDQLF